MEDIIDGREQLPESSTMSAITSGKSKISLIGEGSFTQAREVEGRSWVGSSFQYEVNLPHPAKPNETWTTYLTVWTPTAINSGWTPLPKTQIYITTGQGETVFTKDEEKKWQVIDEISRQLDEASRADNIK